ncbi:MAG: diguanylate cyclase [Candidatus Coatesbacteria bacterium]|nr:MAG: diguanylate cyclase [Candidatus Coatesbacteria bacterium]
MRTRLLVFCAYVLVYVALVVFALYNDLSALPYTLLIFAASAGLFGGTVVGTIVSVVAVFVHAASVVFGVSFQEILVFSYYQVIWLVLYPIMGVITGYLKRITDNAEKSLDDMIVDHDSLVQHDEVTGFYNRRRFFLDLRDEITRAERYENKITIIFIRLSFSRELGSIYGQEAVDALLKRVADIILENTRATDRKARFNEDIIAVIAPQPPSTLSVLIDRLKEKMVPVDYIVDGVRQVIEVRLEVGVVAYPDDATTESALITLAESRLEGYRHLLASEGNQFKTSDTA